MVALIRRLLYGQGRGNTTPRTLATSSDFETDTEALELRPRCCQAEAFHGAYDGDRSDSRRSLVGSSRRKTTAGEDKDGYRQRRMWEKQQQAQGLHVMKQQKASMLFAKRQILEATSTEDLLERAENLIEQDWLGKVDELQGSMYFIGAFGTISSKESVQCNQDGVKASARLLGCFVIALIQLAGPPAVFFSTIFGWGIKKEKFYHWEHWDPTDLKNCLYDWRHVFVTKSLGLLFIVVFVLNGIFVVMDSKQAWFKIYNIFRYLKRSTPNFDPHGQRFLFASAFVKCWSVLWCCISIYVVVGASDSPKSVLFDALGMLFLFNLDGIGGELGFVDADDWPGLRLGWIHSEMVKKNWAVGDEEEPGEGEDTRPPCVKLCGRPARRGNKPNGQPYDTCCRGCGRGEAHDPDCVAEEKPFVEEEYVGGETHDWGPLGWVTLYGFWFTIISLVIIAFAVPTLSVFTPFLLIVPEDD